MGFNAGIKAARLVKHHGTEYYVSMGVKVAGRETIV